jgi:hypothetical protein
LKHHQSGEGEKPRNREARESLGVGGDLLMSFGRSCGEVTTLWRCGAGGNAHAVNQSKSRAHALHQEPFEKLGRGANFALMFQIAAAPGAVFELSPSCMVSVAKRNIDVLMIGRLGGFPSNDDFRAWSGDLEAHAVVLAFVLMTVRRFDGHSARDDFLEVPR